MQPFVAALHRFAESLAISCNVKRFRW